MDKPELKGVPAVRYKLMSILGFLSVGAFDKEFVDESIDTVKSALKEVDAIVIGLTDDQKKYVTDWLEDVEENLSEIDGELHGEDHQALELLRRLIDSPVMLHDIWQPIETAPKDGTFIIAFYPMYYCMPNKQVIVQWTNYNGGSWQHIHGFNDTSEQPTLWTFAYPDPEPNGE